MTKILVGSRAFFSGIEGFKTGNRNFIKLVTNNALLRIESKLSVHGNIIYRVLREPAAVMVQKALDSGNGLLLGNFLVPAFAKEIGLTIDDLKKLQPLASKLNGKHNYQAVILSHYIANGSFSLSDEQRTEAYNAYLSARSNPDPDNQTGKTE